MENFTVAGIVLAGQAEAVLHQRLDRVLFALQKEPFVGIGIETGGVVIECLKGVVLGIDGDRDESKIFLEAKSLLKALDLRANRGALGATSSENKARDLHLAVQFFASPSLAAAFGQLERGNFSEHFQIVDGKTIGNREQRHRHHWHSGQSDQDPRKSIFHASPFLGCSATTTMQRA
jgi:hypothetical protein